ncbi:site-specific DNA-methyltransferase [Rhodococcus sp. H36-A4]|uniref:site-specific DNA-methyltransferase n=1 Tax=Rhodococcus sp. H36-A4 TaxID=3004353 RepID=UPI0022AE65F6|nr:site-specific DNA-methyltransferase [Rhodococcus sp. H36-A4]MCZ4080302.1 site-specific DNA-methyltransferase [Rhodococcus sp. H36-A4]
MTDDFAPLNELDGPGEANRNVAELARLFPDAVVDGTVDLEVLRDLLGEDAASTATEGFGLRWPGMAAARRLSTLPATMTLLPKPDESVDWEGTRNIVIEGDNLEVLRLLRRAYTNSVDVIYIDPPYNTGNDFVYDDKRVATHAEHEAEVGLRDEDGALQAGSGSDRAEERKTGASLHSKWLSMMYPRLLVAHHLLKETGVIIVAIDDTEHARLKLLVDRIFGAENFVANLIWQGGRKNDSRYVSVGHDYMLVYAKNEATMRRQEVRWREPRAADETTREAAQRAWDDSGQDPARATVSMKKWIASLPEGHPAKDNNRFYEFEPDGRVYRKRDVSWPGGGGPRYDVPHPVTKLPVKVPSRGWIYSKQERMQHDIDAGLIVWGKDHTEFINRKTFLDSDEGVVPTSVFERKRTSASKSLANLLDSDVFPYPKDVDVLARWINLATRATPDSLVLDFFAGSGTTGNALMNLNSSDDGSRRYILVQLDEAVEHSDYVTIADITRERLRRAGKQTIGRRDPDQPVIDTGFRSYRLAESNVKPWDGTGELDLIGDVDNLAAGRTSEDLLVEVMLRLGIDLVTPVSAREVANNTLYSLAGTLYAFFGMDVTIDMADEIAKAIVDWRDEEPVDSDITVVVRDTGFRDSSAKLNLAAALQQAGIKTMRSI